tara:strand:- start:199 stop:450 length:252 start_codon:yes stop_codon:yes gene_type:complete
MPSSFSSDFYESILEASDKGELWGIENSDLIPLEVQMVLSHYFTCTFKKRNGSNLQKIFAFVIGSNSIYLQCFLLLSSDTKFL